MKAISIMQPWASLIALGEKKFETRSRSIKYRGELAIQSSKKVDKAACEQEPIKSVLFAHGYTADNLPTGAIIATCRLADCWPIGEDYQSGMPVLYNGEGGKTIQIGVKEEKFGWYGPGRFAWEIADVKPLAEPVPAKGQLGLWNWDVIK